MNSEVCILDDGRRVRFSLKKRERDPFYLACFRGPNGGKKELSTKEGNKRRATDAAIVLVRAAFAPETEPRKSPSWDEAIDAMTRQAEANNLRMGTIQQYIVVVKHLRRAFPESHGPAEITPTMASRFKADRKKSGSWGRGISVRTLKGNIGSLNIVYNKWWIKECKILTTNPFSEVSLPKLDKPRPRVLLPHEVTSFFDWMSKRWRAWRLPILFLETKRLLGCRIMELATASTAALRDGRLYFPADETKGRKERGVKLPTAVYEELLSIAGKRYVWEGFAVQLRRVYDDRGWRRAGRIETDYHPARFKKWLQRQKRIYLKQNPTAKAFKLHNLRGTAMTKAKEAGISYEDAAVAFGCNPDTMRKHYVALDETLIADRVMEAIQGDASSRTSMADGKERSASPSKSLKPSPPEGETNQVP